MSQCKASCWYTRIYFVVQLCLFTFATTPYAQSVQTSPSRNVSDSSSDWIPTTPEVSDLFGRGWRDFSRYNAGMCVYAAEKVWALLLGAEANDTLSFVAKAVDTVPHQVMQFGQQCGERFLVDVDKTITSSRGDFFAMIRLAIVLNRKDLVQQLITQRLEEITSVRDRTQELLALLDLSLGKRPLYFTGVRPVSGSLAKMILSYIDSLGDSPEVLVTRFRAHMQMVSSYWVSLPDIRQLRQSCELVLGISDAMPASLRMEFSEDIQGVVVILLDIITMQEGPQSKSLLPLFDRLNAVFGNTAFSQQYAAFFQRRWKWWGHSFTLPDSVYWMSSVDTIPRYGISNYPFANKVTLVMTLDHGKFARDFEGYAIVKRLHAKYASQGFDIRIIGNTRGYSPGAVLQRDVVNEVRAIRTYVYDYLHLPSVELGVEVTPFIIQQDSLNPGKAGERINMLTSLEQRYAVPGLDGDVKNPWIPGIWIVDSQGLIRWIGPPLGRAVLAPSTEIILDDVIARAIALRSNKPAAQLVP
jgi:hypothetical protein